MHRRRAELLLGDIEERQERLRCGLGIVGEIAKTRPDALRPALRRERQRQRRREGGEVSFGPLVDVHLRVRPRPRESRRAIADASRRARALGVVGTDDAAATRPGLDDDRRDESWSLSKVFLVSVADR